MIETYVNPPYSFSTNDVQCAIWTLLFTQHPATDPIIDNGQLPNNVAVRTLIYATIAAYTHSVGLKRPIGAYKRSKRLCDYMVCGVLPLLVLTTGKQILCVTIQLTCC